VTSAVAKRYARALFALATDQGTVSETGNELRSVATGFAEPPLRGFAEDITLDRTTRRQTTAKIAQSIGLSQLLANFLGVLAEHGRLRSLAAIAVEYARLEDRQLGRVRARIRSARPLSEESRRRILEVFRRRTGKEVLAETEVDPDLLGGVIVEIGGRVFDGSLRVRLERLQQSLSR
jgi:F-type H+-transporting ATPase subunit delta